MQNLLIVPARSTAPLLTICGSRSLSHTLLVCNPDLIGGNFSPALPAVSRRHQRSSLPEPFRIGDVEVAHGSWMARTGSQFLSGAVSLTGCEAAGGGGGARDGLEPTKDAAGSAVDVAGDGGQRRKGGARWRPRRLEVAERVGEGCGSPAEARYGGGRRRRSPAQLAGPGFGVLFFIFASDGRERGGRGCEKDDEDD